MRSLEKYQVADVLPVGATGTMRIQRFSISEEAAKSYNDRLRWIFGPWRPVKPGEYTRLVGCKGERHDSFKNEYGMCPMCNLWMSDTPAEVREHLAAIRAIEELGGRVLINGLGIGVVVQAALMASKVKQVDVVEISPDVIALAGPPYHALAQARGVELNIIEADAFVQAKSWPRGSHWQVVWSDIWPTICGDDLEGHGKLNRSYARRSEWHGSWNHAEVKHQASQSSRGRWY